MFTVTSFPEPTVVLEPWEHGILAKCPSYTKTITPARLLERLANVPIYATDTETTGLSRSRDHVLFWSLSDGVDRWSLTRQQLPLFQRFLEDQSKQQVYANANFDAAMYYNSGVDVLKDGRLAFRRWDVVVMHALLYDNQLHGLKEIAKSILKLDMLSFKEVFGVLGAKSDNDMGAQLVGFYDTDPFRVINYQTLDSWATFVAREELAPRLQAAVSSKGVNLLDYYVFVEMPMHEVLLTMEREGITYNKELAEQLRTRLQEELEAEFTALTALLGKVINPKSSAQLRDLFFQQQADGSWVDAEGNAPSKFTKGGASGKRLPSTDGEVLAALAAQEDPRGVALMRFKERATKLMYLDQYDAAEFRGRIHTTFNQARAATGRLSSSDPNLQNVAKDGDKDANDISLRALFLAATGRQLGGADQAQLEMRIAASQSGDVALLQAILEDKDLHAWTAHRMFGIPYEHIMAAIAAKDLRASLTQMQKDHVKLRGHSKTINFGVIYGETAFALSKQIGCDFARAEELLDLYWLSYPGLRALFDRIREFVDLNGYIETPLGRRRWIHQSRVRGISDRDYARGLRQAGNHPIQGNASELIKCAQIRIYCDPDFHAGGLRQLLQVHDEIIVEAPPEFFADRENVRRFEHYMAYPFGDGAPPLAVPLVAKLHTGNNWSELK